MKIINISPSLTLRELQAGDHLDIFRAIDSQREYLGRWLPFVEATCTVDDSRAFVERTLRGTEPVFTLRLDDEFIGLAGFKETASDGSSTEIGYWMRREHQGRGFMTAAVRELVRFALEESGIGERGGKISIKCAVGNERSRAIPLRLGFAFSHIEPCGEIVSEGVFRDVEVFSTTGSPIRS